MRTCVLAPWDVVVLPCTFSPAKSTRVLSPARVTVAPGPVGGGAELAVPAEPGAGDAAVVVAAVAPRLGAVVGAGEAVVPARVGADDAVEVPPEGRAELADAVECWALATCVSDRTANANDVATIAGVYM
ncbi:MAG: hypothetical protein WCJ30_10870 [Deltaproteobacteria bacterium]